MDTTARHRHPLQLNLDLGEFLLVSPPAAPAGVASVANQKSSSAARQIVNAFHVEYTEDGRLRYKISDELFAAAARAAGRALAKC